MGIKVLFHFLFITVNNQPFEQFHEAVAAFLD